jgi:hypothetical protein
MVSRKVIKTVNNILKAKEIFMNKKKTLIVAMVLFVVFVAGVTAQSASTAQRLLDRDEILARNYEYFTRETERLAKTLWHQQTADKAEATRRDLIAQKATSERDWRNFYSSGGELTRAQQNQMNAIYDRILRADALIGRYIQEYNRNSPFGH